MKEYRTTDTGELAPYPGMTSYDLRDFETWSGGLTEGMSTSDRTTLLVISGLFALLVVLGVQP